MFEKGNGIVTIEVTDLNLAAYLIAKGFKLLRPPFQHSSRYRIFLFRDTPELQEAQLNFFNRNAPIDASTYGEAIRTLLTTIKGKGGTE